VFFGELRFVVADFFRAVVEYGLDGSAGGECVVGETLFGGSEFEGKVGREAG